MLLFSLNAFAQLGRDWKIAAASPEWQSRERHTSVVFSNKIWLLGGKVPSSGPLWTNDVWCSVDGINWTLAVSQANWIARRRHSTVVMGNEIWLMGGEMCSATCTEPPKFNDVWISLNGINWTQVTPSAPWAARVDHASLSFKSNIWVIGGSESDNNSDFGKNDAWYSRDGSAWLPATTNAAWKARSGHSAVVFQNKMWILGGFRFSIDAPELIEKMNDVWYTADGTNWFSSTTNASWSRRSHHTSIVYDDKMWIIGGNTNMFSDSNADMNDAWYSLNGTNWTRATTNAGWASRKWHTSVAFSNQMWVIGSSSNDVWKSRQPEIEILNISRLTSGVEVIWAGFGLGSYKVQANSNSMQDSWEDLTQTNILAVQESPITYTNLAPTSPTYLYRILSGD